MSRIAAKGTRPPPPPPPTATYLAILGELQRLVGGRSWPVLRDGVVQHMRFRATDTSPPATTQRWELLQNVIDTFFPKGITVEMKPAGEPMHSSVSMAVQLSRGSSEAGRQMAAARMTKLTPARRSRIARRAVRARWAKRCA